MFISFGVLIPLGIFFAAYMKQPLAQHGAWFQVRFRNGCMNVFLLQIAKC